MLTGCFIGFFCLVILCLVLGWSVAWALLGGVTLFWMFGRRQGFTHRQLWEMAWEKCKKSLIVTVMIFLIGMMTGLWRGSGTIAYCIMMGMELVTPRLFLLVAFLLCVLLSYVLGTSYGVCSTMGVILMALARSGGVNPVLAAGVVLSGVYFGDRCSPASSAANLVAAVTETDLYSNVRQMLKTGMLPTLLTLLIYGALSLCNPITAVDQTVLSALTENFNLSWTALLPAVVMFVLPLVKVPIRLTMMLSIAVSAVLAAAVQGFDMKEVLLFAWRGYHPADEALAAVMSGGGVTSLTSSYIIVTLAGLYSGILEGTGALAPMDRKAAALAEKIGRFPAMIVVSVLCAMVLCNQAVTSMLSAQLLRRSYEDREELAIDIENSGIMIAGLVPWSIACSIPLAMLGVGDGAILYAVLLWITPLCYLAEKRRFYPEKNKEERI